MGISLLKEVHRLFHNFNITLCSVTFSPQAGFSFVIRSTEATNNLELHRIYFELCYEKIRCCAVFSLLFGKLQKKPTVGSFQLTTRYLNILLCTLPIL